MEPQIAIQADEKKPGLFSIFMMIFRISAFTLGGGAVLIGLIQEAVNRTGAVPEEKTADMLALSLAAPGAMGISMSYQAGLALGGPAGAAAAVFGMALPPFIAILVLSSWLLAHMGSGYISAFFSGATAGLVIVLGAIVWKLAKKNALVSIKDTAVCLLVAAAVLIFKVSAVWGLIGGTIIALIVNLFFEKEGQKA